MKHGCILEKEILTKLLGKISEVAKILLFLVRIAVWPNGINEENKFVSRKIEFGQDLVNSFRIDLHSNGEAF